MSFKPHLFGRYVIIDPIASGGMAEVFRARLANQGANRILVIKKIIAADANNEEFRQMFDQEIKTSAGLNHPNIIQTIDFGSVDGQCFMAMEYVAGRTLESLVARLIKEQSMLSPEMSAYVIGQIALALDYAHSFVDPMSGASVPIIHRDVSPQNIMIGYNGAIKLFDFGIAKSKLNSQATQVGLIKGKPAYLSPEQIKSEPLDGRSDIFALGIVLWELLTAQRLFSGKNDMEVLEQVLQKTVPAPSQINTEVPKELDAIVLKALAKDKNSRYVRAIDLQRDLNKYIFASKADFNPGDLGEYLRALFSPDIKADREKFSKYLALEPENVMEEKDPTRAIVLEKSLAEQQGVKDNKEEEFSIEEDPATPPPPPPMVAKQLPKNLPPKIELQEFSTNPEKSEKDNKKKSSFDPTPAVSGYLGEDARAKTMRLQQSRDQAEQLKASGTGHAGKGIGLILLLACLGGGFYFYKKNSKEGNPVASAPLSMDEAMNNPGKAIAQSTPTAAPLPKITLTIHSNVTGYILLLDGAPTEVLDNKISIDEGKSVKILAQRPGYEDIYLEQSFTKDSHPEINLQFTPEKPKGYLTFITLPEAKLSFYQNNIKVLEANSPFEGKLITVGKYKVVMENSMINYQAEIDLEILPNKTTYIQRELKGAN